MRSKRYLIVDEKICVNLKLLSKMFMSIMILREFSLENSIHMKRKLVVALITDDNWYLKRFGK